MRYAHTKHVCVHLQDCCFTQEPQSGEFKAKWGTWKYLKVSLRNWRSCRCRVTGFKWQQTLLKAMSHLHISKACIMQNVVLHRALHPLIQEREFFAKMLLCHHHTSAYLLSLPWLSWLPKGGRRVELNVCFGESNGKLFSGETKSVMFYLSDTCWLDLNVSISLLPSLSGNKR